MLYNEKKGRECPKKPYWSGKDRFMIYDLQKASMWKRISAFLFDGILLAVVAVLCALGISAITGYDGYARQVDDAYTHYSEIAGVDLRMSMTEFDALDETARQAAEDALEKLNADQQAVRAYEMMQQLNLLIPSMGFLLAFGVMEFLIPVLLKNGQTLGKKAFSLAVMHTDGVKMTPPMLFARTILGKYAVETMVPVFIIVMLLMGQMGMTGVIVLGLMILLEAGVMIFTHTNSAIHDLIAKTVVVDMGSQKIFETREELLAYKQKLHEEKVKNTLY